MILNEEKVFEEISLSGEIFLLYFRDLEIIIVWGFAIWMKRRIR